MGSSSGGKKKFVNFRNRQRANLSFFIVVMFFGVFGIIVFTEIFFIDERDRASGVIVRHGAISYHGKTPQKIDYEEGFQNDDYISVRAGQAMMNDGGFGAFLVGGRRSGHFPNLENAQPAFSKLISDMQLPSYPDNSTMSEGSWQTVNGTRYKFFVFSAYYDPRRTQRFIRVIGATKTRGPEGVWCRYRYKAEGNATANFSKIVPAKIKVIRENWNLMYSACFIMCPLQNLSVPLSVSIVARLKDPPSNMITVINNYNETWKSVGLDKRNWKFAVCVKPLHFNYNKDIQLLEFIELNLLMGIEHFILYNHTVGPQVDCLLRDYIARGVVTVLPWNLKIESQKEIRTEGLFAALNDCLYRTMYKFTHALLIDFDEYVIPKHNDTLPQLIDYLGHRLNTASTGSFSFQNAFFYLQWSDDDDVYDFTDPISPNLVTLKKTRRKTKLHPHKQRSKYICRPELTVEAGNHFIWEFIPGHGTLNVPADAAILHHYRICEFGGDDCIKTQSTLDKTAYRYRERLTGTVRERYDALKTKCVLPQPQAPQARVFHKILNMLKGQKRR
ncbi:beta-1,4-galactosyltransferase galt-1 [Cylas formicarius]|uniref:beta-1,4-galactosyltransferase galt-1 n=1 Tax=Cylas formicarius TaxID=197179 RepID=UPI002958ACCB|nr:beta-1,4-galactosyltransferase galt-1 [Cylas formicarius]